MTLVHQLDQRSGPMTPARVDVEVRWFRDCEEIFVFEDHGNLVWLPSSRSCSGLDLRCRESHNHFLATPQPRPRLEVADESLLRIFVCQDLDAAVRDCLLNAVP